MVKLVEFTDDKHEEGLGFNVVEDLISGKGIQRIYSHLASDNKSPEEIIELCRDKDRFSKETIELFIDSMAYLLSELALTYLPGKGIFLAGGLARSLQEFIYSENFKKNFLKNMVDYAVLEVGLGGRLDATNVVEPVISVITNIGYDHKEFLGNSLEEIAMEKAGIIKHNKPIVIGEKNEKLRDLFKIEACLLYTSPSPRDS